MRQLEISVVSESVEMKSKAELQLISNEKAMNYEKTKAENTKMD